VNLLRAAPGGKEAHSSSAAAPQWQGFEWDFWEWCRRSIGGGKLEESSGGEGTHICNIESKITFENPLSDTDQLIVKLVYARHAGVSVDNLEIHYDEDHAQEGQMNRITMLLPAQEDDELFTSVALI
jgi:hypothetical protein